MKKKVFTLLTLLVLCVTGAWADADPVVLFTTNFSTDDGWSTENIITSEITENSKVIKGTTISFKGYKESNLSVTVGATSSANGTLTFTGSNIDQSKKNFYMAIPLTGVNGSITITYAGTKTGHYYCYDDGNTGTWSSRNQDGNNNDRTWTISGLTNSNVTLYLGTNGKSITGLTITTPAASGKTPSSFALTSADEVEVAIDGNSTITSSGNAGTVTYTSNNTDVATVTDAGVITAKAGGKTTITVSDPGTAEVDGKVLTVTVLVPYPNPAAADSYVLNQDTYDFSNKDNTKYYFKNGFTMNASSSAELQNGGLAKSKKYSHARTYTINVPSNVTVTYAIFKARSNYDDDKNKANWGTVFGTNYSTIELPQKSQDPAEKDFVIETPAAGGTLEFQPGGNQWQAIITLYTDTYYEKKTVSYDKGNGTGSMTGTEKRNGDTFILPASTFTNPDSKYFKGWLCNIDGKRYVAGDTYTMTDAATTFTAQYGVIEGTSMIKAVLQSNTSATITGSIGGTYSANDKVQSRDNGKGGCKLGNDGAYVCINLASGSFKEGDIIQVNIGTAGNGGTFAFYKESEGTNAILTTSEGPTVGLHSFILPAAAEGETKFYIVRKSGSNFNPFVDYVEVYRPHIVTLNASGFATYSKDWDYKVQSGATMYKMALDISDPANPSISGASVTEAPAGAGVLLKGTAGDKAYILNSSQISTLASNSLNGTTDADGELAAIDKSTYDYYVLSGDTFKKFNGVSFGDNKAYFQTANGALSSARAFTITFDDGETTAIKAVEAKKVENGVFYNLAGQQVAQPTKGLYIVNGRKVIVK